MSKFSGFPEPRSNFTPVPNKFFDQVMPDLKEAELKILLHIFRHTFGWQKRIDGISLSQFERGIVTRKGRCLDRGTGLARSTIIAALKSVIDKGYVLRFIPGRGSNRLSYFCLNTPGNQTLIQALESGDLTIEQVLAMEAGRKALGSKFDPTSGSKSEPRKGNGDGSEFKPTEERGLKKHDQKKAVTPDKSSSPNRSPPSETGERVREQALNRRRRREGSTGRPVLLKDALLNLSIRANDSTSTLHPHDEDVG